MPKARTNTITSGSAGSGGGGLNALEAAQRLQERLQAPRTVTVHVPSRTRGQTEPVDVAIDPQQPDTVQVHSASGHTYRVNPSAGTCTCVHHRTRGLRCRHIDAADMALGSLAAPRADQPTDYSQAVQTLAAGDAADAAERTPGETIYEDFFYSDHPELLAENLRQFRREPLPYELHNALNGSDVTFGVELEFVDGDSDAIARELYDMGICSSSYMTHYHSAGSPGKWKLERDGSVTAGGRGGELVSPVLTDTPETWETIAKICEVAKRHGARINGDCGGHVHVGIANLDHARQRWKRFFRAIAGTEEAIYRFSGGGEGRVRHDHSIYATPFAGRAQQAARSYHNFEDMAGLRTMLEPHGRDRYQGINLTNLVQGTRPTVEFRYFNGSLEPGQIQANVKLAAGIMQAAEQARTRVPDEEPGAETRKRRGNMIQEMTNTKTNTDIARLLDFAFSRRSDKDHILKVLAKNMWR